MSTFTNFNYTLGNITVLKITLQLIETRYATFVLIYIRDPNTKKGPLANSINKYACALFYIP